jgi:hypothetical protein
MFTSKDKERAFSLTGNITVTVIMFLVQAKNTYPKMEIPDTFTGDRKKFKAYETQCRIYLWANAKRED